MGTFYPAGLRSGQEMRFFIDHFSTVELNNSFYKMPSRATFEAWRRSTPGDFVFSVKAGRFLTHMKKLKDAREPLERFLNNAYGLGEKLGPILFQLPPFWNVNVERLAEFLSVMPRTNRYVFEFRNESWYNEKIYSLLRRYNCAFCIYELNGHLTPMHETADFLYVRLHGPGGKYQGSYDDPTLRQWAKRVDSWRALGKDVYVYFDNDEKGYAAFNAKRLKGLIKKK